MATLASSARPRASLLERVGVHAPVWAWVVVSRLVVLAASAGGALSSGRLAGWQLYDPTRVSTSLGSAGDVLAASSVRWDALGYITVAQHGYTDASSTRLFPLYPLLIRALGWLLGSEVIAGVLISLVAFAVGLTLVHRIANAQVGKRAADATVLLLAFSPFAFVFSAVYTESLLLALVAATFYLAMRGRFVLACAAAAAAALTHIQGILLVVPLAYVYWRGGQASVRRGWRTQLPALALPPLALAAFLTYMHAHGWGWLAPVANQSVADAGRRLVGTPVALWDTVRDIVTGIGPALHGAPAVAGAFAPGIDNLTLLVFFLLALLALLSASRTLPREQVLFATIAIIVCSSSAANGLPLKDFGRYMLPVVPLWIGAGAWLARRRLVPHVLLISTVMLIFYTVDFTRWVDVF